MNNNVSNFKITKITPKAMKKIIKNFDITSDSFNIINIEAIGHYPQFSTLQNITAIKVQNKKIIETFSKNIKPSDKNISHLLNTFLKFIGNDVIVTHNSKFNIKFLQYHILKTVNQKWSPLVIDTYKITKKIHRNCISRFDLQHITSYFNIHPQNLNDPLEKVYTVKKLIFKLVEEIGTDKVANIKSIKIKNNCENHNNSPHHQYSYLVTYELYKKNKSIVEIANERELKEETIYEHLLRCYDHRLDIDLNIFINKANEKMILGAIHKVGIRSLKKIKQILPEEVKYHEIKAVLRKIGQRMIQ